MTSTLKNQAEAEMTDDDWPGGPLNLIMGRFLLEEDCLLNLFL